MFALLETNSETGENNPVLILDFRLKYILAIAVHLKAEVQGAAEADFVGKNPRATHLAWGGGRHPQKNKYCKIVGVGLRDA